MSSRAQRGTWAGERFEPFPGQVPRYARDDSVTLRTAHRAPRTAHRAPRTAHRAPRTACPPVDIHTGRAYGAGKEIPHGSGDRAEARAGDGLDRRDRLRRGTGAGARRRHGGGERTDTGAGGRGGGGAPPRAAARSHRGCSRGPRHRNGVRRTRRASARRRDPGEQPRGLRAAAVRGHPRPGLDPAVRGERVERRAPRPRLPAGHARTGTGGGWSSSPASRRCRSPPK